MRSKKEIADYILALEQYIAKDVRHADRHKANVIIHANKKDHFGGAQWVYVEINETGGQVIIENSHTVYIDCPNTFTVQDSEFTIIRGTLCIKAKDRIGNEININIT